MLNCIQQADNKFVGESAIPTTSTISFIAARISALAFEGTRTVKISPPQKPAVIMDRAVTISSAYCRWSATTSV